MGRGNRFQTAWHLQDLSGHLSGKCQRVLGRFPIWKPWRFMERAQCQLNLNLASFSRTIITSFLKKVYLFILREREREREQVSSREKEAERIPRISAEPDVGLDLLNQIVRSWPELKPRVGRLTDWATKVLPTHKHPFFNTIHMPGRVLRDLISSFQQLYTFGDFSPLHTDDKTKLRG